MPRTLITNDYWTKLRPILLELGIYDKPNLRLYVEAILYRLRVGHPWRDLPAAFGKPNTIYKRFRYWSTKNELMELFKRLVNDPDLEWVFIDASYVRAHQHSAGATCALQAIGKSRGGNTSKIHLAVDAHGLPIEFILTGGQVSDMVVACELVSQIRLTVNSTVIADKGYSSEKIRRFIRITTAAINIPYKINSTIGNHQMDWYLYKQRHLVENAFARLKQFRGLATRYDKLKIHYQSFVALACAYLWLPL